MILPKAKKTKGFSYIEVMIALALFAIAMLAIVPVLSQAGRNMAFAEGAYDGHLQAQRIMLAARTALLDGTGRADAENAVMAIADNVEFAVWVFGRNPFGGNPQVFYSANRPDASVVFDPTNLAAPGQASTVIAVVWGEDGQVAGRAIGVTY